LIKIGLIVAAHGIRGEVKIRSYLQPPEAIFSCGVLTNASGKKQFTLIKHGGNDKAFIAAIDGISDRNAAEFLKGTELYAPADALPKKKKGDYYSHELIGLDARLKSGRVYGSVVQLYNFGAGDIVEIKLPHGKTEMLPFNESFVQVKKDHIVVHPPEYVEE
jgi:16S rRNA processing protein RimM